MSLATADDSLGGSRADYVVSNFNEMQFLLDVDEPFRHTEIEGQITAPQLGAWVADGILRVVDEIEEAKSVYRLYRVNDRVRDRLEEVADRNPLAPCGHRGVRNLGDDEFSCTFDDCDIRFGRETAAGIVNGGDS